MAKKLSLAALKRHANSGTMYLEMTEWHGKTGADIKVRMQGVRKVLGANSVALKILNNTGETSECRLDHGATLVDYDGENLVIYDIGKRKPTEEEQKLFAAWQQKEKEILEKNPFCETYWQRKAFFSKSAYPYMDGCDMICGKKYIPWEGMVLDCKVRGEAILKYKVTFTSQQAS